MTNRVTNLFVSAVTVEFATCRSTLAAEMDVPGWRIEVQERFLKGGVPVLLDISDYIRRCHVVVHLLGRRSGGRKSDGVASAANRAALLARYPDFTKHFDFDDVTVSRLSYTQWEAFLAIYHGIRLIVAKASDPEATDAAECDTKTLERQYESQQNHEQRLNALGYYPAFEFDSDQVLLNRLWKLDIIRALDGFNPFPEQQAILSFAQYRREMTGFRRYLRPEILPFHPPSIDREFHPIRLLETLQAQTTETRGVLLIGVGGIGKTRTTYETALRASELGWHVLYMLPRGEHVRASQVCNAIFASGSTNVLLVVEYYDQMIELDTTEFRNGLTNLEETYGRRVRILANARTSRNVDPLIPSLLRPVVMDLTAAESQRLSSFAVSYIAPEVNRLLGANMMARATGKRPIIALLIAQQLEALVRRGALALPDAQFVRTGDLAYWLRRRLKEDGLEPDPAPTVWQRSRPSPTLVAASAAVLAAPGDRQALNTAAHGVLTALSIPIIDDYRIVDVLIEMGWLEKEGKLYYAVHDVLVDELAERSLFDGSSIATAQFKAVASMIAESARNVGRLSIGLTRLVQSLEEPKASRLRKAAIAWFEVNAALVGERLANDRSTEGSYAIGALFGQSLFAQVVQLRWKQVIEPWLNRHRTELSARHLLFTGLSSTVVDRFDEMVVMAMDWLGRWGKHLSASFVLGPLLKIFNRVGGDYRKRLIAISLEWAELHTSTAEAGFVLGPLLKIRRATKSELEAAQHLSLRWLDEYGGFDFAAHVLAPMLQQHWLPEEICLRVLSMASNWLKVHSSTSEASRILGPLFVNRQLEKSTTELLSEYAYPWIRRHQHREQCQFVLGSLLNRRDISGKDLVDLLNICMDWLSKHGSKESAQFVLSPMLRRTDLSDGHRSALHAASLSWLADHAGVEKARYVLTGLLKSTKLTTHEIGVLWPMTKHWFSRWIGSIKANFLLAALLDRTDWPSDDATVILEQTEKWLAQHGADESAGFVLVPLCLNHEHFGYDLKRVNRTIEKWTEQHSHVADGIPAHILKISLNEATDNSVFENAISWIRRSNDNVALEGLLIAVLQHPPKERESKAVIRSLATEYLLRNASTRVQKALVSSDS